MRPTRSSIHTLALLVLVFGSGCRQRTTTDSQTAEGATNQADSVVDSGEGESNKSPFTCSSGERVMPVQALNGVALAEGAKFAAASHEFTETADGATSDQIWVLLLPRVPEGGESIFQIQPSINISFSGWPEAGKKYAVSDDCYEPKRTDNPIAVCGELQVTTGEVTYSRVPTKAGGLIELEFNFKDSQEKSYSGIATSCLSTSSSVASIQ